MIEVFYGCMFSGKTSKIKKILSDLYTAEEYLYLDLSESEYRKEAAIQNKIQQSPNRPNLRCIALDELQFLEESNEENFHAFLNRLDSYHVLIALLDMDYLAHAFEVFDMITKRANQKTTVFTHMKGTCQYCSNPSLYSARIHEGSDRILIGKQHYIPCCEACFRQDLCRSTKEDGKSYTKGLPNGEAHRTEQLGKLPNTT